MVVALLLQAVTSTNTIVRETIPPTFYIPVGITLAAALLAAWAAIRNTDKITKTQQGVANLSNQAARDLKDKEFKNDYYKKIIERRLMAYELLEKIVYSLSKRNVITLSTSVGICTHEIYSFFSFEKNYMEFHEMTTEAIGKTLWYSVDLKNEISHLQNTVANIGNEFAAPEGQEIGNERLRLAGVKHDAELKDIRKNIVTLVRKEIIEIQNIDNFFLGLGEPVKDE
jgi:hypothetical protein